MSVAEALERELRADRTQRVAAESWDAAREFYKFLQSRQAKLVRLHGNGEDCCVQRLRAGAMVARSAMPNDRWLLVSVLLLGCALLALLVGFALGPTATRDRLPSGPATELATWNPDEASDEDLLNVFLRAVGAGDQPAPTWRLRKWTAPVTLVSALAPPPSEIAVDFGGRTLASVAQKIEAVAPGLLRVAQPTDCPPRERTMLLSAAVWGPGDYRAEPAEYPAYMFDIFYMPPEEGRPNCHRWADGDGEALSPTLSHGGTTRLRVRGDEITGAFVKLGYSYNIQYGRYDLAVDVLRQKGWTPSAIVAALPLVTMAESYGRRVTAGVGGEAVLEGSSEDPADTIVKEHKRSLERMTGFDATRCYLADFEDHAHSAMAFALSQALGIDWGARIDTADLPTLVGGVYSRDQDQRRPNIELVKQTYRARDYWMLRRYWPLFVSILYTSEIKQGANVQDVRLIAAPLIASRRNQAAYRANIDRQNCIKLPHF